MLRYLCRVPGTDLMDPVIRLHLKFHGQVQGVGFRYRAQHAANALGLTGWVENQWDDSVEMEVQGTEEAIGKMIRMINQGTFVHIAGIERKNVPLVEKERSFRVRGYYG